MKKNKKYKKKNKKSTYEDLIICFNKINDNLRVLNSVSKSLKATAKELRGPVQSNLSILNQNIKSIIKTIKSIKSAQNEIIGSKFPIYDANDFKIF